MLKEMEPIPLANVVAGVKPVDPMAEGANRCYIGYVDSNDNVRYRVFIKDLDRKQLCNELIGAVLGRALSFSIPRPFLALVDPDDMVEDFKLEYAPFFRDTKFRLVFASQDAECPSLS